MRYNFSFNSIIYRDRNPIQQPILDGAITSLWHIIYQCCILNSYSICTNIRRSHRRHVIGLDRWHQNSDRYLNVARLGHSIVHDWPVHGVFYRQKCFHYSHHYKSTFWSCITTRCYKFNVRRFVTRHEDFSQ